MIMGKNLNIGHLFDGMFTSIEFVDFGDKLGCSLIENISGTSINFNTEPPVGFDKFDDEAIENFIIDTITSLSVSDVLKNLSNLFTEVNKVFSNFSIIECNRANKNFAEITTANGGIQVTNRFTSLFSFIEYLWIKKSQTSNDCISDESLRNARAQKDSIEKHVKQIIMNINHGIGGGLDFIEVISYDHQSAQMRFSYWYRGEQHQMDVGFHNETLTPRYEKSIKFMTATDRDLFELQLYQTIKDANLDLHAVIRQYRQLGNFVIDEKILTNEFRAISDSYGSISEMVQKIISSPVDFSYINGKSTVNINGLSTKGTKIRFSVVIQTTGDTIIDSEGSSKRSTASESLLIFLKSNNIRQLV